MIWACTNCAWVRAQSSWCKCVDNNNFYRIFTMLVRLPKLGFVVLLLSVLSAVLLPASTFAAPNIDKLAKGKLLQLSTSDFDIITDLDEKKARRLMDDLEAYKYFQQSLMGVQLIPELGPLRILALGSGSSFKHMDLPK